MLFLLAQHTYIYTYCDHRGRCWRSHCRCCCNCGYLWCTSLRPAASEFKNAKTITNKYTFVHLHVKKKRMRSALLLEGHSQVINRVKAMFPLGVSLTNSLQRASNNTNTSAQRCTHVCFVHIKSTVMHGPLAGQFSYWHSLRTLWAR